MALYPSPLGHRMPYDRDGSVGFRYLTSNNIPLQWPQANLRTLNSESLQNHVIDSGGGTYVTGIIFPELRDIQAVWFKSRHQFGIGGLTYQVETSPSTTNGVDGTWTSHGTFPESAFVSPGYRDNVSTLSVANVKGIRFTASDNPQAPSNMHVYGNPSVVITRLAFWHPTLDAEVTGAYFDWGDVAQGSSAILPFRIKNTSVTNTANAIAVAPEAITDPTPSFSASLTLSDDGVTYAANVNIGTLAPDTISSVLYVKRSTPGSAALSVWAARLVALPGGWS